ncbi:hypothetical protein AMEX_G14208 [Astyanax mexicanus]|uniref:Uncharacterized protein n=1 Tax=Astyanax mexicanus TaxID=7994 RepID=A0A8T2LKC0_ASTMX|nr:hypothetical protein AMEX_G14208 [Astyanax mexicanus]
MQAHALLQLCCSFLLSLLGLGGTEGHTTGRPEAPSAGTGIKEGVQSDGGLQSVLKDSVSPAFSATVIIIVTVIVSGSAYLCFLKYVCAGCCKPTQVAPATHINPNKSEEQV